ncbi:MAG: hypothetical protein KBT36_03335 [Kurthia sp.]|nr:hypothetical protein [Candidatus Kurthia equi]
MRKWGVGAILAVLIATGTFTASAHLTGAFADYLAVVYDDSTIDDLKMELTDTKEEIEELTPKVEKLENEFLQQQTLAIDQLLGYSDVGLDTWYSMLADNKEIVDLLGDQWVMKKAINSYIDSLNDLYLMYEEVKVQQQTLQGHSELLQVIEKSMQRRSSYLAENEGLEIENIANYLDIDWTSEVEEPLIQTMKEDAAFMKTQFVSSVKMKNNVATFDEASLNKQSKARYFFRADHIYVEFKVNNEHVILIGQILQNAAGTGASLQFEAGYYNGFFLPNEDLIEINGFSIPYNELTKLDGIIQPYIKQANGWLEIKSK